MMSIFIITILIIILLLITILIIIHFLQCIPFILLLLLLLLLCWMILRLIFVRCTTSQSCLKIKAFSLMNLLLSISFLSTMSFLTFDTSTTLANCLVFLMTAGDTSFFQILRPTNSFSSSTNAANFLFPSLGSFFPVCFERRIE